MKGFDTVAPYLAHPLVLTGLTLVLLFGFFRIVVRTGIIPQVSQRTGGHIVQRMIHYGFILALVLMLLGFSLQFYSEYAYSQSAERRAELAEEAKEAAIEIAYEAL